ncbi:APC family permease [uncultured Draconibacterium sp.]|uniref:APC family permease n=1 Tax=uncultured Draconibacterium sp. TaxID=1573823 RepID=UPI0025D81983|nr:amino acid permease [uncultured Draconibacterium sp.]
MHNLQKKLERRLGLFPVTNIVIANIIGAGIFTTTGYLMGFLQNPGVMLILWGIGGLVALCGAISFGELGAAFPEAGGEYVFISKLYSPMLGFLSGWLSLIVGFSAPIAASAIGFAKYFTWAFPQLQNWLMLNETLSVDNFSRCIAILVILGFSFIHSRGIVLGARVQNALTLLKILLVVGLITAGLLLGDGSMQNVRPATPFQFSFDSWKAVGLSLMFIMFAYSGWNSATYIGSEIKEPRKVIPRSLLISTLTVTVLYILLNLFFVYAVPASQMRNEPEIGGLAAGLAFGATAETIISLLISFALFSSLSAFIILGPRVYYKMASDGLFFQAIARINTKHKVPSNAILLQAAIAIVLVLSGTFEQILTYMGFSLGIFPIIAVAGNIKLRRSGNQGFRLPGYPYAQVFFIVVSMSILVLAYFERPVESSIAVLTALSGIPVYYWFQRKKAKQTE